MGITLPVQYLPVYITGRNQPGDVFLVTVIAGIFLYVLCLLCRGAVRGMRLRRCAERARKVSERKREGDRSENLHLKQLLQEKENDFLSAQAHFRTELSRKDRMLLVNTVYISDRMKRMEDVLYSLDQIKDTEKSSSLSKQIRSLKLYLKQEESTETLLKHFGEADAGFLSLLQQKHPTLTPNDIRYLIYVHMNLSHKEIAPLLNISSDGCRKRKERLVRKMQLPDDLSLYQYLHNL